MTKLQHLKPFFLQGSRQLYKNHRYMSKISEDGGNKNEDKKINRPMYVPETKETPLSMDDIDEPTNCCMSGCVNCVWIEYAEKLSMVLKESPGDVQKVIMDKVQDPNMRAFLSMELRVRNLIE